MKNMNRVRLIRSFDFCFTPYPPLPNQAPVPAPAMITDLPLLSFVLISLGPELIQPA